MEPLPHGSTPFFSWDGSDGTKKQEQGKAEVRKITLAPLHEARQRAQSA